MDQLGELARLLAQILATVLNRVSDGLAFLCAQVGWRIDASFWRGVIITAFIGYAAFKIRVWLEKAFSPYQPQKVVHLTNKTPWQVFADGCANAVILVLALALIVVVIWGLLNPVVPQSGVGPSLPTGSGVGNMQDDVVIPLMLLVVAAVAGILLVTQR